MPSPLTTRVVSLRSEFLGSLKELASHLRGRISGIKSKLEEGSRLGNEERRRIYAEVWQPELTKLEGEIEAFERLSRGNPSLCAMGKRGQGKTSLLKSWMGGTEDRFGLRYLPTGDRDTTAALIRLIGVAGEDAQPSPKFLHCDMLGDDELGVDEASRKIERPPPFPRGRILLEKEAGGPEIDGRVPYNICRFPDDSKDIQYGLSITAEGRAKVTRGTGESFVDAQWLARSVSIPVDLSAIPDDFEPKKILEVLDIIDAPGADSQAMGSNYQEFKLRKNAYVFKAAIRELEILLIICSSDTSAIQLGGQFQSDIWNPWVERCQEGMEGRLLLAFTKASILFDEVRRTLKGGQEVSNEARNFAEKIIKNVLAPLAVARRGQAPLVDVADPGTWPPIFFFEQSMEALAEYREGFKPGSADEVAGRLAALACNGGSLSPADPLGERCILQMLRDVDEVKELAPGGAVRIKQWLSRSLCRLLDPQDRGFGLLNELAYQYTTSGPVGRNHANERLARAQGVTGGFRELLARLSAPAGQQKTLNELKACQRSLAEYWGAFPEGPRLFLGEKCREREAQAQKNAGIDALGRNPYTKSEVLGDIAWDAVECLVEQGMKCPPELRLTLRTAFHACLNTDPGVSRLVKSQGIFSDRSILRTTQIVGLERVVRVAHYIARADGEAIDQLARSCFSINAEEAELSRPLVEAGLAQWGPGDEVAVAGVQARHAELIAEIGSSPAPAPYGS